MQIIQNRRTFLTGLTAAGSACLTVEAFTEN
ncbi:twin-arginine translocation signal domain-containing protein [Rhizobium giardinii]